MNMHRGTMARKAETIGAIAPDTPRLRLVPDVVLSPSRTPVADWLRDRLDRVIGASSLVSTAPLLDVREFGWTGALRRDWRAIADEARRAGAGGRVTSDDCPATAAALADVPDLHDARFEHLSPGMVHLPRCPAGRALLTCHLGLVVPRDGDVRMQLGGRVARWAEGETLLFDAGQAQWRCNESERPALVLAVTLRRPLRQPGRWLADALLGASAKENPRPDRAGRG
jgi:beta-hydroxylase